MTGFCPQTPRSLFSHEYLELQIPSEVSFSKTHTFLAQAKTTVIGLIFARTFTDTLAGVASEEPVEVEQAHPACCCSEDGAGGAGGTAMRFGGKLDPDLVPANSCGGTSSESSCGGPSEPESEY